ncbi:putative large multifunctional protein-putative glycosyl hydrolase [Fimbriimonas ginsengisoli Gsoil 348]|uniref:Putative large multifunctional protein-putative glycosyl hydrolase n=2 Tax=Fimbriimonas ginsengisoli TaxID=1005039 RepID=A0A068NVA5_FIMGI|nr:putative large multifunctional protein-putative glycosyl hydrolase [Fimbriimonas ginsengisoli Gsoil 348]
MVGPAEDQFPSWVELTQGGGRFVGRFGSARPLASASIEGDYVAFRLPKQYERRETELTFEGTLVDGRLVGTTVLDDGTEGAWVGVRAPELPSFTPTFGEPIELIGSDLSGWTARWDDLANKWSIEDGMLVNSAAGTDLVTTEKFSDFRLVAEYRYPKGSNSGIYLRGRYELQILDDYEGAPNGVGNSGAIYGFLAPTTNSINPPEAWNTAEITLLGRWITVVLNVVTIIDRQEIPGITGGALDSAEGEPGPILVQGDHGPVTFRRLTLYPAT